MRTRRPRLCSIDLRGLLVLGALAVVPACSNDDPAAWTADPALRGATAGELETLVADNADGTSERLHFLTMPNGDRLRLRFNGEPTPMWSSGDRVGVWGDRVGEDFVVSRHVLMPDAEETSITSALIGAPAKPRTAVFVIVDVGGGSKITNDAANTTVFSPGNNFASVYDKLSFGIQKMSGEVQGPFSYPMTTCDYNGLKTAVKPMITGTFQHYMWYIGSNVSACQWSGIGSEGNTSRPQSDSWYNASTGCTVLVQEVGHNMGWMHSSTLACSGQSFVDDPSTCTSSEYGNRMTPMGSGCGMLNGHDLWYGQFIGGCNGVKVTASGTFNLFPLETACNAIQTIQIPMIRTGRTAKATQSTSGTGTPLKNYYIEYRTKTGLDANLTSAVYVYAGDDIHVATKSSTWSWLLDMNPSTSTFDGLAAGGSFTDPTGEIKITVMSADTTKAVVQIDVMGGAGAAPTCMDGSTTVAPGPVDCASGPGPVVTGTGGMGGSAGGTGGTGGTTGGRGGTTGGRGGTGGSGGATGGRGGAGGSTGGSAAGSGGTSRGGAGGSTGGSAGSGPGIAGNNGTAGTTGGNGTAGTTGGNGTAGNNGTAGVNGTAGTGAGKGGASGIDGVTGGCECALDPINARGGWSATALGLLAAVLMVRRRRAPKRR